MSVVVTKTQHHYPLFPLVYHGRSLRLALFRGGIFDIIARMHGPVIWMELHSEGIGGWIHNHEPARTSAYVPIHQYPCCVMPFRSQAKCLLVFISYHPMWIQAQHTLFKFKTIYNTLFHGWPHARITCWCLLWYFVFNCVHTSPYYYYACAHG